MTPQLAEVVSGLRLDGEEAGPALLASAPQGTVLWANTAAFALFATHHLDGIAALLFRSGPASRSFASRLSRIGSEPRLERLLVAGEWPPVAASCNAVGHIDGQPIALLRLDASTLRRRPPLRPAAPAQPIAGPEAPGRTVRLLWEADKSGTVTRIAPVPDGGQDLDILKVGETVAARLRAHAPAFVDRLERALNGSGSVGTRLWWPPAGPRPPLLVEIGCTARPGHDGLRGFLLTHGSLSADAPQTSSTAADATTEPTTDAAAPTVPAEAPILESEPAREAAVSASEDGAASAPPLPPETPPPSDVPLGGNVVNFPALRLLPPAPAKSEGEPQLPPPPVPAAVDADAPRWSESPETIGTDLPDGLTPDEQDAFAHIARVLGTRPAPAAQTPAPVPSPGPQPAAPSALPDAARELLSAVPIGLLLRHGDETDVNAAFLAQVGDGSADEFRTRVRNSDPTAPGSLTRTDGAAVTAEIHDMMLGGRPARLLTVSSPTSPVPGAEYQLTLPASSLDGITDGFLNLDAAGSITAASTKAAALLGYGAQDLVGRRLSDLLLSGLDSGGPNAFVGRRDHLVARTRAGDPVPLTAAFVPLDAGTLCVLATEGSDTARRGSTDAALREAERTSALKSEFLAKVSHEIRTPLNAILGFAEVIRDERLGPVGNSRYLEYLRDIHASGTHVMSLVNDLLDLSRIEAGRLDLHLEAVDTNAVVQACVNTLQTQAHRGQIVVRQSLAAHLPLSLADARSVKQIVLNLLSNAVKFTEPGGQVIVSTASVGTDAVAIRIRDTGIGMTDEEVAAAMEPFRQVSTLDRTGSGLGLPLTKALVEANCASMAIRSTRGEGTLVEVTFPVVEQASVSLPA